MADFNSLLVATIAQNGTTILSPLATEILKLQQSGAFKVNIKLSETDVEYIEQSSSTFCRLYTHCVNGGNHPVLAACRALIRDVYMSKPWVSQTGLQKLVIGSAFREMNLHKVLPAVNFYVHNTESKDTTRVYAPLLNSVASDLAKAMKVGDKAVDLGTSSIDLLLESWNKLHCAGRVRASTALSKANVLLFEDVGYTFTEEEWCRYFSKTGATVGYGYMLAPFELLFPDMPVDPYYTCRKKSHTTVADLAYVGAKDVYEFYYRNSSPSNGYTHDARTWSLIMKKPVFSFEGVHLEVEIQERVGPMICFVMHRFEKLTFTPAIRCNSLPQALQFLRILDLKRLDVRTKKLLKPKKVITFPLWLLSSISLSITFCPLMRSQEVL